MTPDERSAHTRRIYSTLIRERRAREAQHPPGHAKRADALTDIDGAIESLRALTLELRAEQEASE
jgi:hypothetical protein